MAGEDGELEHPALWHVPRGYAIHERLDEAKAIIPSATSRVARIHHRMGGLTSADVKDEDGLR